MFMFMKNMFVAHMSSMRRVVSILHDRSEKSMVSNSSEAEVSVEGAPAAAEGAGDG